MAFRTHRLRGERAPALREAGRGRSVSDPPRFRGYESVLRSGAALLAVGRDVSQQAWRNFVAVVDMERRYPGMVALGYARSLSTAELPGRVTLTVTTEEKRSSLADLVGRISADDAEDMRTIVEREFERVDLSEWR